MLQGQGSIFGKNLHPGRLWASASTSSLNSGLAFSKVIPSGRETLVCTSWLHYSDSVVGSYLVVKSLGKMEGSQAPQIGQPRLGPLSCQLLSLMSGSGVAIIAQSGK